MILHHSPAGWRISRSFGLRAVFTALALGLVSFMSAAEVAKKNFELPAGDAASTLKQFTQQSGEQVVFLVNKVRGVATNPVRGELTAREALERMLAGTPLAATQDEKTGALTINRGSDPNALGAEAKNRVRPNQTARVEEGVVALEKMTVTTTVQKRPQSVQEVPISLTALNARALEVFKVESLRDVSRMTPNLLVSSFSQSNPIIAIRGATNTFSQIGVNKPVAVVIDDVFVPRITAANFELFDLDSVQVLRGPQGTLFGRNVTGGAIVLNTRQPLPRFEAEMRASVGSFNERHVQGFVSGPVTDKVAAKVTLSHHTHDGYGRDRLTGREQDDQDSRGVRGQVLYTPSSTVKVLLSADYSEDANGGRTLSSKGAANDGDRRTSEHGYNQFYERAVKGAAGRVAWQSSVGDFESITAYRESESLENYSGTAVSYTLLTAGSQSVVTDRDHPGTFTQEFRYASPKWSRGDFVSGIYLLDEDGYRNLLTRALAAGSGTVVTHQTTDQKVRTRSYAAYWDGQVKLRPSLSLTVGARFTVDRKQASLTRLDAVAPANNFSAQGLTTQWDEFTPRAVLAWTPRKDLQLYGSVTQGFTSGGYNTEAATLAILQKPFDAETVTNYEAGLKTQFWDQRLRVNLAVFEQAYADKQELYFNTATRVLTIVNASDATIRGAEVEVGYTPVDGLNVTVGYGALDATYDRFVVPGVLNYTGNPLGSSPENKFSAGVDYEYALGPMGRIFFAGSYSWVDDYYTGATKDPNLFVPAYALVNGSLGYESLDRRWRVSVWGKNLADTAYLLTPSTQGGLAEYLGEPRTYGVTLGWRF